MQSALHWLLLESSAIFSGIHGVTNDEQELKLKQKLLNEISHMEQSSFPCNNPDAKIRHHDFDEVHQLDCKQLQDWMVGAKIIYRLNYAKRIYKIFQLFK